MSSIPCTTSRCVIAYAIVLVISASVGVAQQRDPDRDPYRRARAQMVALIESLGVQDSATLAAMRTVPRHEFVPPRDRDRAYGDHPLPIGLGQTISQPYIVAYMTEVLQLTPDMRVLEVGTGSGYQAAVLAALGVRVFTIEIFEELAGSARHRLARLGYQRVTVRHGDGHFGWTEEAAFDAVIVTAAAGFIPPALTAQLKPGGRMVIPVGSVYGVQTLILVLKDADGELRTESLLPVRFVPMLEGVR
jgi:protein-L-isoaspartate(D-aspartate) O-methyltransferase